MDIIKKILWRFLFAIGLFFIANFFYSKYQFPKDVAKYSRVKGKIDTAFANGEIVYMGESSNTSFNPWTDTFTYSISDYMQMYLPDKKITSITHESFHPGLFLKMLNLLPDDGRKRTLVITLNMRTCGPSAMFSGNEASNQQEALFYSQRLPLLTRIFLSMHYYDNKNPMERERLKFQYWRTRALNKNGFENPDGTVKKWLEKVAYSDRPEKWRHMADAYIKEFAFILDGSNDRVQDLDQMVKKCKKQGVNLLFHLLPASRDYAQLLYGNRLIQYMDYNADFLANRYSKMGATVINNYKNSRSVQYTDQWYPTEHLNAELRREIAESICKALHPNKLVEIHPEVNNRPNPEIRQPMADTMLKQLGIWH
ncbi:MAG: hypothetical protein KG003_02395 [Bacteroidetes bacterium]|nr:hypothetical protein [Bacteroidota bacterium]